MPRIRLRDPDIPPALNGWLLINSVGIPRYWSTVWSCLDAAALQESTLAAHLSAIESFYQSVERQLQSDCLDRLISELDLDRLESCLEGYFVGIRNRMKRDAVNANSAWRSVIQFVRQTLDRLAGTSNHPFDEVQARLLRLEQLYQSLNLSRTKRPDVIRALPAEVLEELYELITPHSVRNPFRTETVQWRNFALVLLLLHQGLRRSEALVLPADALKYDTNSDLTTRFWLNVDTNPYEAEDPRADDPSLKNGNAIRQIPVAESIANIIETYVQNYRGRPAHSFLFSSQEGSPLAKRSVNALLTRLSNSLSPRAKKALVERTRAGIIQPHALRHTCAVVRLQRCIDSGVEMDMAVQKLRVFFGWSRTSMMPHHYARAFFERRLATVWQDSFDAHVEALRKLSV